MNPANESLELSPTGLSTLTSIEKCDLEPYRDGGGVWTAGYGHTGLDVVPGVTWTQEQAIHALTKDVLWARNAVRSLVSVPLNQHQFDALVIFTFNVGEPEFKTSTLLRLINSSKFPQAALEFPKWVHDAKGQVEPGLVKRRDIERKMFLTPA